MTPPRTQPDMPAHRRLVAVAIVAALALAAPLSAAMAGHVAGPERPVHAGTSHDHGADAGDGGHGLTCSPATCHGLAVPPASLADVVVSATPQTLDPTDRRAGRIALAHDPPVPRG